IVGGTLMIASRLSRDRLLSCLPLLVALCYGAVMTTRAPFMFAGVMWIAAYLGSRTFSDRRLRVVSPRLLSLAILVGAVAIVTVFVLLQTARGGQEDLTDISTTLAHVRIWFFGHLSAVTLWMKDHIHDGAEPRVGEA